MGCNEVSPFRGGQASPVLVIAQTFANEKYWFIGLTGANRADAGSFGRQLLKSA